MEKLNDDVRLEIFSRLPPEQLLKCKLVCKDWENLLSHKKVGLLFSIQPSLRVRGKNLQCYFGDYDEIFSMSSSSGEEFTYNNLTKINHPVINNRGCSPFVDRIVGSCNGLVCFNVPHHEVDDPVYICNPMTTEYINLPRLKDKYGYVVGGFGYLPSVDKYKVIRIHYPKLYNYEQDPSIKGSVEVYTLGSGTGWRSIGEQVSYKFYRSGVLANGSLYWLDYVQKKIVAFDLADEEFRCLPTVPDCFSGDKKATYQIKVLGGDLCLVHLERGQLIDIWSVKSKQKKTDGNNDKEERYQSWSWTLEFHIPCSLLNRLFVYEPFALTKSREVLLWINDSGIYKYAKRTQSLDKVVGEDHKIGFFQGIPHMNSFISMKDLGEKFKSRTHQKKEKKNRERIIVNS